MLKALRFFLFATLRLLEVPTAFTMHSDHSLIFPNSFSRVYLAAGRTWCCWQQQQQCQHPWAALIWPHKDICSDRWWLSAYSRDCFCPCHESQASLFLRRPPSSCSWKDITTHLFFAAGSRACTIVEGASARASPAAKALTQPPLSHRSDGIILPAKHSCLLIIIWYCLSYALQQFVII